MSRNRDEKEIYEDFCKLPVKAQKSLIWVVKNMDMIHEMIAGQPYPAEELKQLIKEAYMKEDYVGAFIFLMKQYHDENRQENCQDEE